MKFTLFSIAIIFVLLFHNCSIDTSSSKPPELIEFRTIDSSKTDSVHISELIYKEKYEIEFFENENVYVKYDTSNKLLALKPNESFTGLTFIKFKSNGDDKYLPLIIRKKTESGNAEKMPYLFFLPKRSDRWLELILDTKDINEFKFHVLLDNNLYSTKFLKIEDNKVKINLKPLESFEGTHALRIIATKDNLPGNVLTAWIKDGKLKSVDKNFIWNETI